MASSKATSKQSPRAKASSMAELMKRLQAAFYSPQKGENVKGTITKLTPSEILVNINAKTDAVVLEKEKKLLRGMLQNLHVGQEVEVTVLNPESEMGYPVVSLRKFLDFINWQTLGNLQKEKSEIEATVLELTRGGYLVETEFGIYGFLPNSQIISVQNVQDLIGKKIKVFVWELSKAQNKVIFSQKPLLSKEEFENVTRHIKLSDVLTVPISNITPFGLFVTLPGLDKSQTLDGLIHISEVSWDKVENLDELYSVGQNIQVYVIGKDIEAKRIDLSIKRLQKDPFEEAAKQFTVDQKVSGKVASISLSGAIIDLGEGIEGIIRKEKIPPGVSFTQGQEVTAIVSQIDTKRRKIILIPVLLKKTIGYR